jgi:hypothetical protein
MEDKLRAILDRLPAKRPRSCLAPYQELIYVLRRRGLTYREIAGLLSKELGLHVVSTTIIRFVRAQSKAQRKGQSVREGQSVAPSGTIPPPAKERKFEADDTMHQPAAMSDIQARIAAIKNRPPQLSPDAKPFRYDPNEPLRLPPKSVSPKTKCTQSE